MRASSRPRVEQKEQKSKESNATTNKQRRRKRERVKRGILGRLGKQRKSKEDELWTNRLKGHWGQLALKGKTFGKKKQRG